MSVQGDDDERPEGAWDDSAPSGSNANEAAGGGAEEQTVVADCP